MRILKLLSTNLHILLISMLIVGLGLGLVSDKGSPKINSSKQAQAVVELSTTPTPTTSAGTASSNATPPTQTSDNSLNGTGNLAQASTSDTANPATPVVSPPTALPITLESPSPICDDNCTTDPAPLPIPPSNGCGVCGTFNSSKSHHIMCPMYCMRSDQ